MSRISRWVVFQTEQKLAVWIVVVIVAAVLLGALLGYGWGIS